MTSHTSLEPSHLVIASPHCIRLSHHFGDPYLLSSLCSKLPWFRIDLRQGFAHVRITHGHYPIHQWDMGFHLPFKLYSVRLNSLRVPEKDHSSLFTSIVMFLISYGGRIWILMKYISAHRIGYSMLLRIVHAQNWRGILVLAPWEWRPTTWTDYHLLPDFGCKMFHQLGTSHIIWSTRLLLMIQVVIFFPKALSLEDHQCIEWDHCPRGYWDWRKKVSTQHNDFN